MALGDDRRFKRNPELRRDAILEIRLTRKEKADLEDAADAARLNVSEYVRSKLFVESRQGFP